MSDEIPKRPNPETLRRFLINRLHFNQGTLFLVASIIIGLAAGTAALVFEFCYHGLNSLLLESMHGETSTSYLIILVPAVGGLLVGLLMKVAAKSVNGHGVPEVIESVNLRVGLMRFKSAVIRTLAAVLTLGFGGSAGPEGPMVHMGSAIGSVGGRTIGSSEEHTKVMIACGAAAGLSAIFHAPMAGVIFVLEVILADFSLDAFIPVIVSSVTAAVVTRTFWGKGALLAGSSYTMETLSEVPFLVALGLLCAILSISFIKSFVAIEEYWKKLKIPNFLKPAIGGLLVGIVAYRFPQILSDGYQTINSVLVSPIPIAVVLWLIVAKLVMTSVTLGSGGSGGIFAPTLFLGALAGSAFGTWASAHFPNAGIVPGAFALVGMGAAMAGTFFAPVTAVIMIFEVTNNYYLILPLMIASITSVVVARRFARSSIYTIGLLNKGVRLYGGRDENLLRSMKTGDIMRKDFPIIPEGLPLIAIFDKLSSSPYSTLPVADGDGNFKGVLPFESLRLLINESSVSWLLIAKDLYMPDAPTLRADEDLRDALAKFANCDLDELPVLSANEKPRIIGMLSRGDLLAAYNNELLRKTAGKELLSSKPIELLPYIRRIFQRVARVWSRFLHLFVPADKLARRKSEEASRGEASRYNKVQSR